MDDSTITSRIRELRSKGLSLRDIASRLLEEGGPKLDPKTIGARLKEPTDSQLEHITQELRPLAMACSDLRFDPRNPNTHPEAQKAAVRASLAQFGQMKPIVANTAQKGKPVVIAGNATLEAALALGWTHIAVNRINVSEAVAKAYSAADKRTADMSEWEPSILAAILVELESEPIDMAALGFDDGFVRQALEAAQGGDEPEPEDESRQPDDEFREYGEDIETEYRCPKCSYCWSGKPK